MWWVTGVVCEKKPMVWPVLCPTDTVISLWKSHPNSKTLPCFHSVTLCTLSHFTPHHSVTPPPHHLVKSTFHSLSLSFHSAFCSIMLSACHTPSCHTPLRHSAAPELHSEIRTPSSRTEAQHISWSQVLTLLCSTLRWYDVILPRHGYAIFIYYFSINNIFLQPKYELQADN